MSVHGPVLFDAGENVSCRTCRNIAGNRYCLLHSIGLKNADTVACQDWEEEEEPQRSNFMNKEQLLTVVGWVLLGIGMLAFVVLVGWFIQS